MAVNYTNITVTSRNIITKLQKSGLKLTDANKQMIIDKVYKAIKASYSYEDNGCNCGQPSCHICN